MFSLVVQKSVVVLSFSPTEAGARLLGDYGAGILIVALLTASSSSQFMDSANSCLP